MRLPACPPALRAAACATVAAHRRLGFFVRADAEYVDKMEAGKPVVFVAGAFAHGKARRPQPGGAAEGRVGLAAPSA